MVIKMALQSFQFILWQVLRDMSQRIEKSSGLMRMRASRFTRPHQFEARSFSSTCADLSGWARIALEALA
jgi:hypothetical protein